MEKRVKRFAEYLIREEELLGWRVVRLAGGNGHCSKKRKEIMLGDTATFGVVLHEIAHALDKEPHSQDGHWGYHADLMHQLFDKHARIIPHTIFPYIQEFFILALASYGIFKLLT